MPTAVPITAKPLTPAATAHDPVRSIVILAVCAFTIGFVGFLAMDRTAAADPAAVDQPAAIAQPATGALVASPASDDWNIPKKI